MDKKDKLHELIRSMSMAEKRRFTIDASQHTSGKERKYILLFDVMVEMKDYHTEALVEVLKSHGYATQHLASDKNYLYNLIIKSLSSFYSGKNTSLNIKEKLHQVEILFERGLYEQCISILKKTESQARKYDLYALLIEIATWKGRTYERLGEYSKAAGELQHTLSHMAWMDNRMAFKKLFYQMQELVERIPSVRNEQEMKIYKDFISHPFLENEEIPLSFHAGLDFWRIHQHYHQAVGNVSEELEANHKLLGLMESQADYIEEFPYDYATILSRILRLSLQGTEEAFEENLERLQSFPSKAKKLKRSVEARVNIDSGLIRLEKLIKDQRYEEAINFQKEMDKVCQLHRKHMKKGDIFKCHFLSAVIFVKVNRIKDALDKVNVLLNEHRSAANRELQISLEILNMVVHYHLGNFSLLKYRAKSLSGQLSRSQRLYKPEEEIFRLFSKLSNDKIKDPNYHNQLLVDAYELLNTLMEDPLHRKAFHHFDFLVWLNRQKNELSAQLQEI